MKWEQRDEKICIRFFFLMEFDWGHFLGFLDEIYRFFDEKSVFRGVGLD